MNSTRYWAQFPHNCGGVNWFTTNSEEEEMAISLSCYEVSKESWDAGQNPL